MPTHWKDFNQEIDERLGIAKPKKPFSEYVDEKIKVLEKAWKAKYFSWNEISKSWTGLKENIGSHRYPPSCNPLKDIYYCQDCTYFVTGEEYFYIKQNMKIKNINLIDEELWRTLHDYKIS